MDSTQPVYIYVLIDPRTDEIRYVGKTNNPGARLRFHIHTATRKTPLEPRRDTDSYRSRWIREVLGAGFKPILRVVKDTTAQEWQDDERIIIHVLKANGARLTNTTAGGEGVDAPRHKGWTAKMSAALKGRVFSPETIERMHTSHVAKNAAGCKRGHPWTPENTKYFTASNGRQHRLCRICERAKGRRWREQRRKPKTARTTCRNGHPWTEDSAYVAPGGTRYCRICTRARGREYRARLKGVKEPRRRTVSPAAQLQLPTL